MSDCTDIHTQTSCVRVCNELIKNAEQHAVKAHGYKAPEFFGTIKLDTSSDNHDRNNSVRQDSGY
jgi:hypothetical protein